MQAQHVWCEGDAPQQVRRPEQREGPLLAGARSFAQEAGCQATRRLRSRWGYAIVPDQSIIGDRCWLNHGATMHGCQLADDFMASSACLFRKLAYHPLSHTHRGSGVSVACGLLPSPMLFTGLNLA
jgi:carbonic anhydrase/acetyltransferase-like protein (isoleucine patch superfamily)